MTLFPLDFEEFLWVSGEEFLCAEISDAFKSNAPLPHALHQKALELYRVYLIIGGMPWAVLEYTTSNSLIGVPDVQNKIMNDSIADMAKYADNTESVKIRAAYNPIPAQLAKDNKKFQYKLALKGGTSTIFGAAIDWLNFAGVVLKCQRLEQGYMPIKVYTDLSSFKLYMNDVGLLAMKSGMAPSAILADDGSPFLGAIAENYVAQALHSNGYELFYWVRDKSGSKAELDFVLQKGDNIIPIEVKWGEHTKSRSLDMFRKTYTPAYAMRISAKNFGCHNGVKAVPLYAVWCV